MAFAGKIVFSSGFSLDFDIWSIDLASGELFQLTAGAALNDSPKWSPDGKQIAFISAGEDMVPSLWIMNSNGGDQRRLTTHLYCQTPSWSPDGQQIIFAANSADRNDMDICTISPDGGAPTRLFSHTGIDESPSFSPDGNTVLFISQGRDEQGLPSRHDTNIMEYNIASKEVRTLCAHPARDSSAVYSPDGSHIAFISNRNHRSADEYYSAYQEFKETIINGSNAEAREALVRFSKFQDDGDVFVMDKNGGNVRQLTDDSRRDNSVCWSPCGNYLMYTSAPHGHENTERLRIIEVESGRAAPFRYNRRVLEREIGASQFLNVILLQKIVPDPIERLFMDRGIWGEERRPHWINAD